MNRKIESVILAFLSCLALCFLASCGGSGSNQSTPPPPPTVAITATSGGGQSAAVSTAFANPLVATVTSNGSPSNGVSVTFTAPASGAGGAFTGGSATDTETTNSSGVATSQVFTANTTAGAYSVTAATSGTSTTASFGLTNTAGPAAKITATSGGGQSAADGTAFAKPLVATVTDSNNNAVSGVSVTFTAPQSGASGTFAGGSATDTEATNSSGVATSSVFTANSTAGGPYNVTATSAGLTPVSFSLTNTAPVASTTAVFYLSGQEIPNANNGSTISYYAVAGSVRIDANGNVLAGEQDYNDGDGVTSPQPSGDSITGGSLTLSSATGQGTLTLITNNTKVGVAGTETLGVQFANPKHALIMEFDGSATSSGSMDVQNMGTPSGSFAYTLSGVDNSRPYNASASGGVFAVTGTSVAGVADQNDNGTVTLNQAFTGTLSAADAFGRGTLTIAGSTNLTNYYIVGPEAIRLIQVNTNSASVGSAFGQGAGGFTNGSLGTSVLAIQGNPFSNENGALAQFSTSNPASNPSDFTGVGDDNELGNAVHSAPAAPFSGTYSIASSGYGSMTLTSPLGSVDKLQVYMTDPLLNLNDPNNTSGGGGALVLDMDPLLFGTTGVIVPQTDTSIASFTGKYAMGAQDGNNFAALASPNCTECEFDMIAQGTVTGGVLSATGDVSDPLHTLMTGTGLYAGSTFNGTPSPDTTHPGRYSSFPLGAVINSVAGTFNVVIYQASGGQLFWLDVDSNGVWLGPLEQQGSLTGLPAVALPAAKPRVRRIP